MGSDIGYGQQTGLFAPHLAEHYDLCLSSFYGLEGARLVWGGIPVLPGIGQDFGNLFLLDHAKSHFGSHKDGLVLTLLDVWVLNPELGKKLDLCCWVPVDHEPCIPAVIGFFKKSGAVPIAMSKFGQEQLKAQGLDALYVPHGVDTNVYKPYDQKKVRQAVGVPKDAFLIGMVAANKGVPSRKGFQQALQAFRIFHQKHPEAILYLHTVADPKIAGGEDIMTMAHMLGISDSVVTAPAYRMMYDPFPAESMAQIYSAMDVLVNPAMGEGFGVPILEAAACGVPSVVTNFSSMPEVSGEAGWQVGCRPYWTPGKSWQAVADVEEIVDALEICYSQSNREREERSQAVRRHALNYGVSKVAEESFLPALEEVHERFGQRAPLEPVVA